MEFNPRKTTIRGEKGAYRFFIVDIPSSTFRVNAKYYKNKRKLDMTFAIELFYTLDHVLQKYNLRLFVPEDVDTIVVDYEDKSGNVLDSDRFEI